MKKHFRKGVAIALACALVASNANTGTPAAQAAAKNVTLKKTTYNLSVGQKRTIQLKAGNGVKISAKAFKSNNSSIASVNKKGVVVAKKEGTAKITVKVKFKKKKKTGLSTLSAKIVVGGASATPTASATATAQSSTSTTTNTSTSSSTNATKTATPTTPAATPTTPAAASASPSVAPTGTASASNASSTTKPATSEEPEETEAPKKTTKPSATPKGTATPSQEVELDDITIGFHDVCYGDIRWVIVPISITNNSGNEITWSEDAVLEVNGETLSAKYDETTTSDSKKTQIVYFLLRKGVVFDDTTVFTGNMEISGKQYEVEIAFKDNKTIIREIGASGTSTKPTTSPAPTASTKPTTSPTPSVSDADDEKCYLYKGFMEQIPWSELIANGDITVSNNIITAANPDAMIGSLYIPTSIKAIGNGAFKDCKDLTRIYYYDDDTYILLDKVGDDAFSGCTSLKHLDFYQKEIGKRAFKDCKNLDDVRLVRKEYSDDDEIVGYDANYSTTKIGEEAFSGCTELDFVYLDASVVEKGAFDTEDAYIYLISKTSVPSGYATGWIATGKNIKVIDKDYKTLIADSNSSEEDDE